MTEAKKLCRAGFRAGRRLSSSMRPYYAIFYSTLLYYTIVQYNII